ncbi:UTP--glucose-1-phosphate uridylyltransferase GalU [Fredinandcohnia onubensis]|uniref:UTP--glucose-1-phosphate uridylyltransferase GalU n=1 Tax=Fredinandcohnia onubensis TaxID=1571209 RepID=UPI000C0BBC0F|nr:UTP--glucose-1-phosphate uridylyltransferase GalU [Fredinandcohnia onubensis]
MRIKKAIIPAAGLGTRFLPATKAQPKEMLPIVDKPTIQYIIEEAVKSGIEDIMIVSGRGKRAIEDHFDKSYELEKTLSEREKWDILEEVQKISNLANIHYIRQKEPLGLGHAIYCARSFIGNEPFAVLLGDDIVQNQSKPCIGQLIKIFNKYRCTVLGVQEVEKNQVSRYGIVGYGTQMPEEKLFFVNTLVEKPSVDDSPSNLAIMGRYILQPEIMDILYEMKPDKNGEIQLTEAIKILSETQNVVAHYFEGKRYDIGDKLGFVKATVDFALQRNDIKQELLSHLKQIVSDK